MFRVNWHPLLLHACLLVQMNDLLAANQQEEHLQTAGQGLSADASSGGFIINAERRSILFIDDCVDEASFRD